MKDVFIIAEIAQAHEGSLGIAHSYIDALADTGVDAIKFQTHIAEAESSSEERFRINFSYQDSTRFDYWKRMEFTFEQWVGLRNHCIEKGMEFISSPFSIAAVELLEKTGVNRYKIGSGELTNYLMLHHIGRTGKPIIISSGMSDWNELDKTIAFLRDYKNSLTLLQCTTAYPTKPIDWGLNVIQKMRERYKIPIGFSDHSASIEAPIAAVALGAEVIEFHVVFHKNMFGPDSVASLPIDSVKGVVNGIRNVSKSLASGDLKTNSDRFSDLRTLFGKSLAVNKSLAPGHIVSISDLESKKPFGLGISASDYNLVIGKRLKNSKEKWDFLKREDFEIE
ncbi:MAG: N-acetylneuraminate synthase family protein [Bacteroidia bacterium]|nr:N-acetylneuraminate synthase family protein [Bacteroidia bacterium]